ncbi:MAG: site-specific DNA-methyltransferase [Nitrospirae bacterium]|nr:site-specific DNA-methyltransferase [Nitrospirota bacterium]
MSYKIICGSCTEKLKSKKLKGIDLTFLDPPFNQGKEYAEHDDNLPDEIYWQWMQEICSSIYALTSNGGAIYFMQREKNTEYVLNCLRTSGWNLQNLIVWKKKSSAVPCSNKFGKHYQIIAFATKGKKSRVFNRLRINPSLPAGYKLERENGLYVTDVWDDIRELTSGYFAGDEALRNLNGERFHKQQAPISLLLRIILSSTKIGDTVLDPFAGTGTTLVVAEQLGRKSLGIELDPMNVECIENRLTDFRNDDNIQRYFKDYIHTENLSEIWDTDEIISTNKNKVLSLFR